MGLPGGAVVKNLPANAGNTRDTGSIPGLGRSSGEGNWNPLQYSCLGNPMDRGAWHVFQEFHAPWLQLVFLTFRLSWRMGALICGSN